MIPNQITVPNPWKKIRKIFNKVVLLENKSTYDHMFSPINEHKNLVRTSHDFLENVRDVLNFDYTWYGNA